MSQPGGRRGFSLWNMVQNMNPVFHNDSKQDVDLQPQVMDDLLRYHLTLPHPRYLDANSIKIAGICDNIKTAQKTLKALIKNGYVQAGPDSPLSPSSAGASAPPPPESPVTVNTHIIDRHFSSRLAIIPVHSQRRLISLLFFWEEECNRWRALDREEAEIRQAMKTSDSHDLKVALDSVLLKQRLLPSMRSEGAGTTVPPGREEQLPSYT